MTNTTSTPEATPAKDTRSWQDRLWSSIKLAPGDDCWVFKAVKPRKGQSNADYGSLCVNNKTRSTHRLAWESIHGPIPKGLHVLHKCDNRPCCRPNHLFLGTHAENMKDKGTKGKQICGTQVRTAKLTDEKVLEIRELARKISRNKIATIYRVSFGVVDKIVNGSAWKHVANQK